MKKQITVTYSKDLVRRYFSYVFDKKGTRTKAVFAASLSAFAVFAVLSAVFFGKDAVVSEVNLFYVFVGLAAVVLSVAAVYALSMLLYPRLSAKRASRSFGKTVVYEFTDKDFFAALPNGNGKKSYPYRVMVGFAVAKGCIFVYGTSSAAFILPFDRDLAVFLETKLKRL